MGRAEAAVELHGKGCNCAQAVLAVFANDLGLGDEDALRIATAFGGGMGRTDGICGSVSGACMVLGLRSDMRRPEDKAAKDSAYARMQEFTRRFVERHGDTACTGLLGVNLSTSEGMQAARDRGLFSTRCNELIRSAVDILESMGEHHA
jgi:C_GCAxxG_C_C family probable redox protein